VRLNRSLTLFLLLVGLAVGALLLYRQRAELFDRLDLETRHRLIATLSGLTARRPETGERLLTTPRPANLLGVNTFLEQDVTVEARRRSLEMIQEAGFG